MSVRIGPIFCSGLTYLPYRFLQSGSSSLDWKVVHKMNLLVRLEMVTDLRCTSIIVSAPILLPVCLAANLLLVSRMYYLLDCEQS